jgi:DNA polymerase type B, organellar and viral
VFSRASEKPEVVALPLRALPLSASERERPLQPGAAFQGTGRGRATAEVLVDEEESLMSFGPLHGKAKKRKIRVYDLEWVPGDPKKAAEHKMRPLELRVIGTFDGDRYQWFRTIPEFLRAVCTPETSGTWFYAHAGGLTDMVFLLEYLVDNPRKGRTIRCSFSGSSAIIVRIDWGKWHWYFVDSYWLIRQPLREIGKWLGLEKGGQADSTDHFYAPLSELVDYNERDNRVLYTAIRTFEGSILALGGELQKTIASTALNLFRRRFMKTRIYTDDFVNECSREAYHASRVEVFEPVCFDSDYYDVNSSFPYAMTFDAPGNVDRICKRLRDGELGLSRARVSIPECDVPPAPFRGKDSRVYFPTGIWESWFSNTDLELIEERGGQILDIRQSIAFEPFSELRDYAQTIYDWRKSSKDEALRVVLKFLLNSLYGKFGEGSQKQEVVINPGPEFFELPEREPGGLGREMLLPGVHAVVEEKEIAHAHVPIAMHITAVARKVLYNYIAEAPKVYYCDTDGFAVPGYSKLPTSPELGGLKLEKHIFRAEWAAPKLYAYQEEEGGPWTVKGKGFSRVKERDSVGEFTGKTRRMNYEDFRELLEHKDVYLDQFGRLRALWRDGVTAPRERVVEKTYVGKVRPKRAPHGQTTRPWKVSELR